MELNPKYPQAVAWYATFIVSFIEGQSDEGVALMRPIVEQDPLSGYNRGMQSILLANGGRYDEGIAEALLASPVGEGSTGRSAIPLGRPSGREQGATTLARNASRRRTYAFSRTLLGVNDPDPHPALLRHPGPG